MTPLILDDQIAALVALAPVLLAMFCIALTAYALARLEMWLDERGYLPLSRSIQHRDYLRRRAERQRSYRRLHNRSARR